ncbi:hypothetical protein [Geotalea uraniireducens]|nr:hypothetical protein [Geotalea uraniireducens]
MGCQSAGSKSRLVSVEADGAAFIVLNGEIDKMSPPPFSEKDYGSSWHGTGKAYNIRCQLDNRINEKTGKSI